jgi:hypothetical protein
MTQHARTVTLRRQVAAALALALIVSLLVIGAGMFTGRAAARDVHPEFGSTHAKNGVLKRGCRNYRFSYKITPPDAGDWALETFIIGPKGKGLASDGFIEGFDKTSGSDTYRLCRATTRPGIFKIKAKLSTVEDNETFEAWLPVTRYRLRNPR